MLNDRPVIITGVWKGHYRQHNQECPIQAELTQEGDEFTGTMTDGQTETDRSLFETMAEAGLPPGADEQIDENIRKMMPEAGNEPIRAKTTLPSQSLLAGKVEGQCVRFIKLYQGEHFSGFQVGDKRIGHMIENHSVEYSGRLSGDAKTIEGKWRIGSTEGSFVLRKT